LFQKGSFYFLSMANNHKWKFARVGGIDRVTIETGADLVNLHQLDQKLWTALSCPVYGLEIDSKTLEYMDLDHDKRLRVIEVLAAIKWLEELILDTDELIHPKPEFPLSLINANTENGARILNSAKQILNHIGRPDAESLTVEETSDTVAIFADTAFNGDGVITSISTHDDLLKSCIEQIVTVTEPVMDRSGLLGVNQEIVDQFFEACANYIAWVEEGVQVNSEIQFLGESTADAYELFGTVEAKINDYFFRCNMAKFDESSLNSFNQFSAKYEAIVLNNAVVRKEELSELPLSFVDTTMKLNIQGKINPSWSDEIEAFKKMIVAPLFGDVSRIDESQWRLICEKFSLFNEWQARKPITRVEELGYDLIKKYVNEEYQQQLTGLIAKDMELEEEANSVADVDKLVRYYRDIYTLISNFVTFNDFYSLKSNAVFQSGVLYIDRRSCKLCVKISDVAKHSASAGRSGIYLIYCDCVSQKMNEKMTIVAALTNGDVDDLCVGRNGVFYDVHGNDWDATIIKIIENPVSIRQAFWMPYKRVSKMINNQIEKFASSKDKEIAESSAKKVEANPVTTPITADAQKAKPKDSFDIAKFAGIFAAIGIALGAIGTTLLAIFTGFLKLEWWQMPIAIAGVMLAISGPSMLLAYIKLRKRNLAPILDANGWAVNAKALINLVFGKTLTDLAILPKNSTRVLRDPYAEKKFPFIPVIIGLLIAFILLMYVATKQGWIHTPLDKYVVKKTEKVEVPKADSTVVIKK
jgi:hypothetical protein